MGNCIGASFAVSNKNKKVSPDVDDELKVFAVGGKNSSQHCSVPFLKPGDNCRLISQIQQRNPDWLPDAAESCNGQRVKIVVNKKQLLVLMKMGQEMKVRRILVLSEARNGKKWRPSLATIPEL